jgi:diaminohydroxyphosphoribosylaminopyrimidine deaminase/5-amino-6-(5-phosphoribosylamino)uracil reductase
VLDSTLRTPAAAKVFQQAGDALLVAAGNAAALESAAERYGHCRSTVQLVALPVGRGGIDLRVLLLRLAADWQCNEVLVEAGPVLPGAFLQAGLVDELVSYVAPCLLGHEALPLAVLPGMDSLQQRVRLRFLDAVMFGDDLRIRSEVLAAHPEDDACSPE